MCQLSLPVKEMMWQFEFDAYLDTLHAHFQFEEVIVGSNTRDKPGRRVGADAHAKAWADRMGINTTVMDANWVGHGTSGGPRRNNRMLKYLGDFSKRMSLFRMWVPD
jgi:hypothetical protein